MGVVSRAGRVSYLTEAQDGEEQTGKGLDQDRSLPSGIQLMTTMGIAVTK